MRIAVTPGENVQYVLSTAKWYKILLKKEVTMIDPVNQAQTLRQCRVELASPETDWDTVWRRVRTRELTSEVSSHMWKSVQRLLPCEKDIAAILPNSPKM